MHATPEQKEAITKIKELLSNISDLPEERDNYAKVNRGIGRKLMQDEEIAQMVIGKNHLEIGESLLTPIKEIMEYESFCHKATTPDKDLKDGVAVNISVPINLYSLAIAELSAIQERARQQIAYQLDMAAIDVILQDAPYSERSLKDGFKRLFTAFDDNRLPCDMILLPRALIADLVNELSQEVDPVGQRELVLAGYVGSFSAANIITVAGTLIFELTKENEFVGICTGKFKREVISPLKCVEGQRCAQTTHGIYYESTVKLSLVDPKGAVWVAVDK
jgi:hypothetical protein